LQFKGPSDDRVAGLMIGRASKLFHVHLIAPGQIPGASSWARAERPYFFGANQASVTVLSMMCC
jgi:hypothetical protein